MEEFKKKSEADAEKEIIFSKSVKAGKRIYYLDVKKNRKDEMYVAITESKKNIIGEGTDNQQVTFEKHKIFLYREDFEKFVRGLSDVIGYINQEQGECTPRTNHEADEDEQIKSSVAEDGSIKIDIDF